MNTKIFIEYENIILANLCKQIYDLFLKNNYNVTILDNSISINEKEQIISNSKNSILISNKLNNTNSFEIVYALKNTNKLAIAINDAIKDKYSVLKYYQKRSFEKTNLDYYQILRSTNGEGIIIFYPSDNYNKPDIATIIYNGITDYLNEKKTYTVLSGDSLYSIARKFNTSVDELKRVNNLVNNNLSIGQKLIIPTSNDDPNTQPINTYIVQSGDSLYAIARKYNTSVDELKRINNLVNNNLSIGQKLVIPTSNNDSNTQPINTYIVKSGDSLYSIAKKFNTSVDELKRINNLVSNNLSIGQKLVIPTSNNDSNTGPINTYIAQRGDSLYAIAKKFNTSVDELKRINNLVNNNLSIGQKLIIPQ